MTCICTFAELPLNGQDNGQETFYRVVPEGKSVPTSPVVARFQRDNPANDVGVCRTPPTFMSIVISLE